MSKRRFCTECGAPCQGTLCDKCFGRPATEDNLIIRFLRLVDTSGDCWIWLGGKGGTKTTQYGIFRRTAGEPHTSAHRVAYELWRESIPKGLHLDHTCLNTLCVNPEHLEAVTPQENRRRQGARITHCPRNHELQGENLYIDGRGNRSCRRCRNERSARRRLALRGN